MIGDVELRDESYDANVVQALAQEMADDLAQFYGPASYPPSDPALWTAPAGCFLVAYAAEAPAGCGGFVRFDDDAAEIKRMFVRPAYRGGGVARQLLSALERRARALGYRRMVLETGRPQVSAVRLYRSAGYVDFPCWPPHDTDPISLCLCRDLAEEDTEQHLLEGTPS